MEYLEIELDLRVQLFIIVSCFRMLSIASDMSSYAKSLWQTEVTTTHDLFHQKSYVHAAESSRLQFHLEHQF